jgi:predicted nucleic acid-binding protein
VGHPAGLKSPACSQRYQWILWNFAPIPFDSAAAWVHGALCASVRLIGRDPNPRRFDLLIAAVAVTAGYPLLTRNAEDFHGIHPALSLLEVLG